MPSEGVKAVDAEGSADWFKEGFKAAELAPQLEARRLSLQEEGKLNEGSGWTLFTDGDREYYKLAKTQTRQRHMPEEGVNNVYAGIGGSDVIAIVLEANFDRYYMEAGGTSNVLVMGPMLHRLVHHHRQQRALAPPVNATEVQPREVEFDQGVEEQVNPMAGVEDV